MMLFGTIVLFVKPLFFQREYKGITQGSAYANWAINEEVYLHRKVVVW
jgi:hypothetical protein